MKAINLNYLNKQAIAPKKGTIQLGDITHKYSEDEVIWITTGNSAVGKKKLCTAVIDKILVKTVSSLTSEDILLENPTINCTNKIPDYLTKMYHTLVTPHDTVSVITYYELAE
ncbi:MAG: hypothetical protein H6Q74_11 [Firmicutes bacterium]|nr:hypothetical protein [Bacillota bacterium]